MKIYWLSYMLWCDDAPIRTRNRAFCTLKASRRGDDVPMVRLGTLQRSNSASTSTQRRSEADLPMWHVNSTRAPKKRSDSALTSTRRRSEADPPTWHVRRPIRSDAMLINCQCIFNPLGSIAHICAQLLRTFGVRSAYTRAHCDRYFLHL